ncbi:response regulator [bacterium]|nr:response regulator [bacterium]
MKILIIDDEPIARMLLNDILEDFSWEIVEAENCFDAYEKIKGGESFDVALVDWNTPKMSGLDFVKNVRELSNGKDIPLIMTTGQNDMENVQAALMAGANEYLMKPFDKAMVLDKLRMVGLNLPE